MRERRSWERIIKWKKNLFRAQHPRLEETLAYVLCIFLNLRLSSSANLDFNLCLPLFVKESQMGREKDKLGRKAQGSYPVVFLSRAFVVPTGLSGSAPPPPTPAYYVWIPSFFTHTKPFLGDKSSLRHLMCVGPCGLPSCPGQVCITPVSAFSR